MSSTVLIADYLSELRSSPSDFKEVKNQILNWGLKNLGKNKIEFLPIKNEHLFGIYWNDIVGVLVKEGDSISEKSINIIKFENEALKGSGWSIKRVLISNRTGRVDFSIEPTLGDSAVKPRYLYHATPTSLESKIKRQGIKPSANSLANPLNIYSQPRVYFFDRFDHTSKELIKYYMWVHHIKDYSVFKFDTFKFDKFNLYKSRVIKKPPTFYTLTHIPPNAVEMIHRETAEDEGSGMMDFSRTSVF